MFEAPKAKSIFDFAKQISSIYVCSVLGSHILCYFSSSISMFMCRFSSLFLYLFTSSFSVFPFTLFCVNLDLLDSLVLFLALFLFVSSYLSSQKSKQISRVRSSLYFKFPKPIFFFSLCVSSILLFFLILIHFLQSMFYYLLIMTVD